MEKELDSLLKDFLKKQLKTNYFWEDLKVLFLKEPEKLSLRTNASVKAIF